MRPIKKILLPTDFSPGSDVAAKFALNLANQVAGQITVFHVAEFPPYGGYEGITWITAQMLNDAEMDADKLLKEFVQKMGKDVPIHTHLETKERNSSKAICDFAKTNDFDVVVIGRHGRTGINKLLLGSVTDKIVRSAPCPVLVIPLESD